MTAAYRSGELCFGCTWQQCKRKKAPVKPKPYPRFAGRFAPCRSGDPARKTVLAGKRLSGFSSPRAAGVRRAAHSVFVRARQPFSVVHVRAKRQKQPLREGIQAGFGSARSSRFGLPAFERNEKTARKHATAAKNGCAWHQCKKKKAPVKPKLSQR